MNNEIWDVIVAGGGTSGTSAAISAAKNGAKVLIVEKNSFLGGSMTASLVTPMMKNTTSDGKNLNSPFFDEIYSRLSKTGDAAEFKDGNKGWFNPEMLKCTLDDLCEENNVKVLFQTEITSAEKENSLLKSLTVFNKSGFKNLKAKFFIDATGDADLANLAGLETSSDENQALSLRFNMAGIDVEKFANWILDIDENSEITQVDFRDYNSILLSTAHTWNGLQWKLRPYFTMAVKEGVLKQEDGDYFQVFSIPGQNGSLSFNCPRIFSKTVLNPLNDEDLSYAYIQGRKQIRRIANFCRKYLQGFEDAYVSQIAPQLGIRVSRRIKGEYILSEDDIFTCKKFDNAVAKTNYPIDVHSTKNNEDKLDHFSDDDYYEVPFEALKPLGIENLLVVGRCFSASFKAQASARIIPNCISMGEYAGKAAVKYIKML